MIVAVEAMLVEAIDLHVAVVADDDLIMAIAMVAITMVLVDANLGPVLVRGGAVVAGKGAAGEQAAEAGGKHAGN